MTFSRLLTSNHLAPHTLGRLSSRRCINFSWKHIFFKNLLLFLREIDCENSAIWTGWRLKLPRVCETGCTMYYVLPLTTKEYLIVTTLDSSLIIVVSKTCCARGPLIKGWPREPSRICQFWGGERDWRMRLRRECVKMSTHWHLL